MQINSASMQAHQNWLNHSAHNVANSHTEGFRASHIEEQGENPALATQEGERMTDLAREMPEQMIATRGVEANAQAIETYDAILGTLLNLKA